MYGCIGIAGKCKFWTWPFRPYHTVKYLQATWRHLNYRPRACSLLWLSFRPRHTAVTKKITITTQRDCILMVEWACAISAWNNSTNRACSLCVVIVSLSLQWDRAFSIALWSLVLFSDFVNKVFPLPPTLFFKPCPRLIFVHTSLWMICCVKFCLDRHQRARVHVLLSLVFSKELQSATRINKETITNYKWIVNPPTVWPFNIMNFGFE